MRGTRSGGLCRQGCLIYLAMKIKRIFSRISVAIAGGTMMSGSVMGALVMDQIGQADVYVRGLQPTLSQIFADGPDYAAYDCMAIDDFTVSQSGLRVTNVSALFQAGGGFDMFQGVAGYQLSFFSVAAAAGNDLAGDLGSLLVLSGAGASVTQVHDDMAVVSLQVNITLPAAGTYWVGVSPVASTALVGNFYLQSSGAQGPVTPGNGNGMLANPGGGLGGGLLNLINVDYAYSITAIPEPSAITLGLLGGLACFRRRRTR